MTVRRIAAVFCFLLAGCASAPRASGGCEGITGLFHGDLDVYADAVDAASRDYQDAQWKVETAAPDASMEKMSAFFAKLQEVTYNRGIVIQTRAADDGAKGKDCPMRGKLARARRLLDEQILTEPAVIAKEKQNQDLQDALEKKSNAFRLEVPGEKEPISKALYGKLMGSTAKRADREKLYRKFQSARAKKWIEWGFKDLVKSRNEEGTLAGFKNYYEYRFFRNGLDLHNFRDMVAEVKQNLAPKVRAYLAKLGKEAGIKKVESWDMRYLREHNATGKLDEKLKTLAETTPLEVAKRFYAGLGIDIDKYQFTMDLFPRAGKNTHAFAMGVVVPRVDWNGILLNRPKPDIRFLANLKTPVKWNDISTVIHELGHAVHTGEIRQPVGVLRGLESVGTEAIAMTFERMAGSPEFLADTLKSMLKLSKLELREIVRSHGKAARAEQAFVLLRQIFFSDFEYEMYLHPDADYAAIWSKLHAEWWGVDVDPGDADWDVEHFVMAPVYVQNYAIGILMVEQLYQSIQRDFNTSYHSVSLGDKLKRVYFAPGEEFTYLDLTKKFTGEPLTAAAAMGLLD
jgi:oligoendopeptidase F